MMKAILCSMILLGVVATTTLYAGEDNLSPRLVGMGGAFTAVSRGLDAVGTNPANLSLNDRNASFTLNLAPVGVSIGSDFINYGIYKDFFTGVPDPTPDDPNHRSGKVLTDQDKEKILGLFPGGVSRTQAKIGVSPIGFSLQVGDVGFAFVPSVQVASNVDLPQGFLQMALNGFKNDPEGTSYSLYNTAVNASAIADFNLSAAYILPIEFPDINEISVGIGVKYLLGLAYTTTDHYNGVVETKDVQHFTDENGNSYYLPQTIHTSMDFLQYVAVDTADYKPVGSGMGFDIGASGLVLNAIRVGISVTDIGSITWDKHVKAIYGKSELSLNGIDPKYGLQDSLSNAFKGQTVDTTAITYSLPTALHIGAEFRMDDLIEAIPFGWIIAVDSHFGFNNVPGNTKLAQYCIGTELDPLAGWLPLRTGIIIGGRQRFGWSAGFGLHFANTFDLDFATQSVALLTNPNSFRTGSIVVGMRFRF
jgi:hypothetical protein